MAYVVKSNEAKNLLLASAFKGLPETTIASNPFATSGLLIISFKYSVEYYYKFNRPSLHIA